MSYIKRYSIDEIIRQVRSIGYECYNPRNDGFIAWGCKQDLYQIYFALDEILKKCPTFVDEQEYLNQHSKKQMWNTLQKEAKINDF